MGGYGDHSFGSIALMDLLGDWKSVFPELDRFESKESRKKAMRCAGRTAHATSWFVAICTVGLVVGLMVKEHARKWLPVPSPFFDGPFAWIMFLCIGVCYVLVIRKGARRALRQQLNDAGMPTCMDCGYDLRGQIDPRCPECGREFTLLEVSVGGDPPLTKPAGNGGDEVRS